MDVRRHIHRIRQYICYNYTHVHTACVYTTCSVYCMYIITIEYYMYYTCMYAHPINMDLDYGVIEDSKFHMYHSCQTGKSRNLRAPYTFTRALT